MYPFDFFMKLYFMDYINDVVIPENNKRLNSAMNFSDYFGVIGCRLIMVCYVGHSTRDFFLKYLITPHKGAPIRLNHIIYGRRLENISRVISYKNISIPEFNDPFFYNRGRYMRGGTIKRLHMLTHHGSVLLMSKYRSGLTAKLSLGGCFSPASLTLLGTITTKLRVINLRLFIMLI